jgi:hypothetical protein
MEGKFSMSAKVLSAGFALATMVMLGCQQTEPVPSASFETEDATVEALRLGVKVSDSCKSELDALREAFLAAKGDSALKAELIAKHESFVGACVVKSESVRREGRSRLSRPPLLTPDSAKCAWNVDAIDSQDSTVEVRYRHQCADRGEGKMGGGFGERDSSLAAGEKPVCDSNHVRTKPEAPSDSSQAE